MIVSREASGLCVVLQVDHQVQCRVAAESWGNADFACPEPWGPVVRAAAVHDEGWRRWEAFPEVGRDGRPVDFPDLDRARHVDLFRAGITAAFAENDRVGLLVSMHGEGLYRARLGLDGVPPEVDGLPEPARGFVREQRAAQESARLRIGGGEERDRWEWAAYRLLQTWDALSLYLTWRGLAGGREWRLPTVPRSADDAGGVVVTLSPVDARTAACRPFPFRGDEAVLPVAARVIPDRRYASDGDLRTALAAAAWERREYRIVPGG